LIGIHVEESVDPCAQSLRSLQRQFAEGSADSPLTELGQHLVHEAKPFTWKVLSEDRLPPLADSGVYAWLFRTPPTRVLVACNSTVLLKYSTFGVVAPR
jgi:hypothetical protein